MLEYVRHETHYSQEVMSEKHGTDKKEVQKIRKRDYVS